MVSKVFPRSINLMETYSNHHVLLKIKKKIIIIMSRMIGNDLYSASLIFI